ncbi:Na+/H+ antiporter [Pandoraea sputorum]|uniref:Sodium, potassium, lithium and rubidium/H(+) antiporter n=1 Tax=Pandoraea sputorum TaxID=93222 RepID=A0A239S9W5_9BURK|nr:Na+/H+ antiporter [Pandoraea sputorum]APD12295.1 Na+/H+ antiporter [Pandoraea sputorum]SNU82210.1 Sodium, potassium, lithium and rubidium/H(+) antiporter [Pandoraea sputorum]VVE45239.1 Na+/H+ antiporter [Pandoraea sputorum]VVE82134.1 Na+/H+ antiporter [Pandoraea sputorum]
MEVVYTALILLFVVALTGVLVSFVRFLPVPLVQIAVGAALAYPGAGLHIDLDPEIFFLLFIPPLLFADGWRMPKREFWHLRVPIVAMALGLVIFTVLGVGYFIHWMIPSIPLAVAFALGGVLSPTDAVAVSALTGRMRMPTRLMHVLEGEAMMNDASGLVAFKFALVAATTGVFSIGNATFSFFVIALGGLLAGWAVTWLFTQFHRRVLDASTEEPATVVLLLLLMPFAAYLLAEHFGFSGILAAVAAGMTVSSTDLLNTRTATRILGNGVWSMLEFVFNGAVFVLLGLQLPDIVRAALRPSEHLWGTLTNLGELMFYVGAISAVLIVLRFCWVWVAWRVMYFLGMRRGEITMKPGMRFTGVTALSGVRGAVTLAGALSVPLALPGGAPFPGRDLLIFLAAGVILLSLIGGSLGLPILLRGVRWPVEDPRNREMGEARLAASEAAIRAVESLQKMIAKSGDELDTAVCAEAAARVMGRYRRTLNASTATDEMRERAVREVEVERRLRAAALQAERVELSRLRITHRINDETLRELLSEIDFAELALGPVDPATGKRRKGKKH